MMITPTEGPTDRPRPTAERAPKTCVAYDVFVRVFVVHVALHMSYCTVMRPLQLVGTYNKKILFSSLNRNRNEKRKFDDVL